VSGSGREHLGHAPGGASPAVVGQPRAARRGYPRRARPRPAGPGSSAPASSGPAWRRSPRWAALDNVVLTSHRGWTTRETLPAGAVDNVLAVLDGRPQHVVNPEALARAGA
jgi:hypothetical protein